MFLLPVYLLAQYLHFTKLCHKVAKMAVRRDLSQLSYMLLGKLEGNIDAVGERRKLQEEVLSVWGGGIQYTSENRYYDRSIHTGCAAVPEGKAV